MNSRPSAVLVPYFKGVSRRETVSLAIEGADGSSEGSGGRSDNRIAKKATKSGKKQNDGDYTRNAIEDFIGQHLPSCGSEGLHHATDLDIEAISVFSTCLIRQVGEKYDVSCFDGRSIETKAGLSSFYPPPPLLPEGAYLLYRRIVYKLG